MLDGQEINLDKLKALGLVRKRISKLKVINKGKLSCKPKINDVNIILTQSASRMITSPDQGMLNS